MLLYLPEIMAGTASSSASLSTEKFSVDVELAGRAEDEDDEVPSEKSGLLRIAELLTIKNMLCISSLLMQDDPSKP